MNLESAKQIKANELKLKNHIKDFTVSFKKRYDKFPWALISKVPNSSGNEIVTVQGSKFTVKSLKAEIEKIHKNLRPKTKPSAYNYYLTAHRKEAIRALKTGGDINRIYSSFKDTLDAQFKQSKNDLLFCIEGMKQLTKYLKEKDKIVKESMYEYSYYEESSRANLKDSEFGIPSKRKFPLDTEAHVKSAIKFFNYADEEDRALLAKKIKAKAKEYNIELNPGENNKLSNYIKEREDIIMPFDKFDDEMKNFLLESYDALLMEDDDDVEEFTEGQNLQMRNEFKRFKAERKQYYKAYKKAEKAGDYKEAKANLLKLKELNQNIQKVISTYDANSVGSMLFSWLTSWTVDFGRLLVTGLASYVLPPVGIVIYIKDAIQSAQGYEKAILAKGKESSTAEKFNSYKKEIQKVLVRYDKAIDAAIKNLDTLAKNNKAKEIKESVDAIDDQILALYSECAEGRITVEEREAMIANLKEYASDEAYITDAMLESDLAVEESKHEKFAMVKKVLYEKCSNGEITTEQREDLIDKAYDRIFETEDTSAMTNNNTNNDVAKETSAEAEKISKDIEKETQDASKSVDTAQA